MNSALCMWNLRRCWCIYTRTHLYLWLMMLRWAWCVFRMCTGVGQWICRVGLAQFWLFVLLVYVMLIISHHLLLAWTATCLVCFELTESSKCVWKVPQWRNTADQHMVLSFFCLLFSLFIPLLLHSVHPLWRRWQATLHSIVTTSLHRERERGEIAMTLSPQVSRMTNQQRDRKRWAKNEKGVVKKKRQRGAH